MNVLRLASVMAILSFAVQSAGSAENRVSSMNSSSSGTVLYQDWQDSTRHRVVPIKIYEPKAGSAPYPVVIFSHGLGGSREAAVYLGNYWSEHGYFCVFMQHAGSDTAVWQSAIGRGREAVMDSLKPAANGQNLIDRVKDTSFVIDELEQLNHNDPKLKGTLDLSKIAIAGHSFGAGTALAIAGQSFIGGTVNTRDKRVKAAIYLCPPVSSTAKSNPKAAYGQIHIPGMLLTGTEDNSPIGRTPASDRRIPFDSINAPHQYLINFVGADHSVFGGRGFRQPLSTDANFQRMIQMVTTEFLDANLKGDTTAEQWLDSKQMPEYLGSSAQMERK